MTYANCGIIASNRRFYVFKRLCAYACPVDMESRAMEPIPATVRNGTHIDAMRLAKDERIYDLAEEYEETLSPEGLVAFIGEMFGSLGGLFTFRR
jgi:hypothetical protein